MQPLVVDNSILSAVAKCDTYCYVRYALGLTTREENLAMGAGSSIHLGMKAWLDGQGVDQAVKVVSEDYERRVEEHLRLIARTRLTAEDRRFEPEWIEAIFHQYLMRNEGKWPFKVVQMMTEVPVHAPFDVDVPSGKPVTYVARLDAIVRKWESGGKWLMDHKTTKKASDWWIEKEKVSSQFTGQLWLAGQGAFDFDPEGVVLNVMEIPEPHRSDKVCPVHKVSYQECSVRHAGGTYTFVTRHAQEMVGWLYTVEKLIRRYDRLCTRAEDEGIEGIDQVQMQGRFSKECTFCDQKEWCRLGRNTSARAVEATFVQHRWNPLREG